MAYRPEMFGPTRGFRDGRINGTMHNVVGPTLVAMATTYGILFFTKSPITRLVWQIDRRCLGLPGGFWDGRFNGTMQNVVGPPLVAMATKFGLGAEIQTPTRLL